MDTCGSEFVWRKSSASGSGNCVEVAMDREVLVRDSRHPERGMICFSSESWMRFLLGVRRSRFRS